MNSEQKRTHMVSEAATDQIQLIEWRSTIGNVTRRKVVAKALFDLSKYTVLLGLIALILNKLDWMTGIALSAVAIVTALSGVYVLPRDEAE